MMWVRSIIFLRSFGRWGSYNQIVRIMHNPSHHRLSLVIGFLFLGELAITPEVLISGWLGAWFCQPPWSYVLAAILSRVTRVIIMCVVAHKQPCFCHDFNTWRYIHSSSCVIVICLLFSLQSLYCVRNFDLSLVFCAYCRFLGALLQSSLRRDYF